MCSSDLGMIMSLIASDILPMDTQVYPGKDLSPSRLIFALNEELKRVAYSSSYVVDGQRRPARGASKNDPLASSTVSLSRRFPSSTRTRRPVGDSPRVEEFLRSHKPSPVGCPFPHLHPSLFPRGPFPRQFCMPSLAKNLPPTRRTMVPVVPLQGRGLRKNSPRASQRVSAGYNHRFRGLDNTASSPYRTDRVP